MPRRKALLIGINYSGSEQQLNGCINDAINCRNFLVEDRGWSDDPSEMVMLTDAPENEGTMYFPTMENVLNAIRWLVTENEAGDSAWLSYSGHGGTHISFEFRDARGSANCPKARSRTSKESGLLGTDMSSTAAFLL
jgi:uncharacterized caspase-like protein